ncbi:DUF2293 domain-containing protein [Microlunatus parietis]
MVRAAESSLADAGVVSPIGVLIGLGWLTEAAVERWRYGKPARLEPVLQVDLAKATMAIGYLETLARERGLRPSETDYVARTVDRRRLQFSESGDPGVERRFRTHWLSPDLPERKQQQLAERQSKPPDLVVISARKPFTCAECSEPGGDLLIMEDPGPLCLTCAGLDHLVFLPSGNTALTRRAKKASRLSAVVVRFSTTRKRYERQGLLVEEAALADAEQQTLADEDARARQRERAAERRSEQDLAVQARLADKIRRLFPGCPAERAEAIAGHTNVRGSGRVGRTAAGRALDPDAITRAVIASIRHQDTEYEDLLMAGVERHEARARVQTAVEQELDRWRPPS